MKHMRIGMVLLLFLLAGMAMVPMASAAIMTIYVPQPVWQSGNMYYEGTATVSGSAASFIAISCNLVDQDYNPLLPGVSNSAYNAKTVPVSGTHSCTPGIRYHTHCTAYSTGPTTTADVDGLSSPC